MRKMYVVFLCLLGLSVLISGCGKESPTTAVLPTGVDEIDKDLSSAKIQESLTAAKIDPTILANGGCVTLEFTVDGRLFPVSYEEAGIRVTTLAPGFGPHLHLTGSDLLNHDGPRSQPYEFKRIDGKPFTVQSVVGVDIRASQFNFTASSGAVHSLTDGTNTFSAGFNCITSFKWNALFGSASIDDLVICDCEIIEVGLDIKPTSCPNPLNTKNKGVLPVAVLGTSSLNVNEIDVSTVKLEGVSALRSDIEDVATPVTTRQDACDCTTDGPDGFNDLTLKFDTQTIVAALDGLNDGDIVQLGLTGELTDGTPIRGVDCIVIKKKGKK